MTARHGVRAFVMWAVFVGLAGLLASCAKSGPHATLVFLKERELGGPAFPTRLIVTHRYLRIDPDTGTGNYILFDRKRHVIYSVNVSDRTILVIHSHLITLAKPPGLVDTVKKGAAKGHFRGHALVHYRLFTDGQQCYKVVAAKTLLPHVVSALKAYEDTLASEQARSAVNAPPGLETPCDLADNVFDPGREYAFGFPVRITDFEQNEKVLVGFKKDAPIKRSLFVLPPHYVPYSPGEIRNGA